MAVEIYMPKMSDHMEHGGIVKWLVREGDRVEEGQAVVEIETDKVTASIDAPASGVIEGIRKGVVEGASVPVGETIAFIAEKGEEVPALPPLEVSSEGEVERDDYQDRGERYSGNAVQGELNATPVAANLADKRGIDLRAVKGSGPGGKISKEDVISHIETGAVEKGVAGRVKASPAARRKARELGIDIAAVTGTGPGRLVSEKDILAYKGSSPTLIHEKSEGEGEWQELTRIQKLTGERMLASVTTAPQFSLDADADMEKLLVFRDKLMQQVEADTGKRLSITALLVKAVAAAFCRYPRANSSFSEGRIKIYKEVNIGIAVGAPDGLVVPVIKNADKKSPGQINREIKIFEEKSKVMRFGSDDLSGGYFTISNLGMYGIDRFRAIVNPPQGSILAVGRVKKTPVCIAENTIAIRPMMNLTLSVDHRCMDGVQGAQFLSIIRELIEGPDLYINEYQ